MAALLRSAVRRAAAPAFRFSGHPAATGAATRRAMHTGGWHRFYASPVFSGGGEWERIDHYFAVFALTVALAYRHYALDQADKRWDRKQRRRDEHERLWGLFHTGIPNSGEGSGVNIDANM